MSVEGPNLRVRKRKYGKQIPSKKTKVEDIDFKCYETLDIESDPEIKSEDTSQNDDMEDIGNNPTLPPMCHCVECFAYMGEGNPRQFCYKRYCSYEYFNEEDMLQIRVYHLRSSPYYDDPNFMGYKEYHKTIQKFIDDHYIESISDNDN